MESVIKFRGKNSIIRIPCWLMRRQNDSQFITTKEELMAQETSIKLLYMCYMTYILSLMAFWKVIKTGKGKLFTMFEVLCCVSYKL